jgi:lysophospholipid acyltransferase (LPLAT)-like uncharacterized protein
VASPYTLKQRLILAIVPRLAYMAICCLGVTLRYRDICDPGALPGYDTTPPAVYALWHRCLLACAWRFRNHGVTILISQSFDGELIARTVERLGFVAIRGSSSRDGTVGLRNLQRAYLSGHYCGITADGPRGPSMVAKPGVTQLAKLVNTTVSAFYAHPDRAWQLRSWDRFLIPKPFSRVTIAWTAQVSAEQTAVQAILDHSVALAQSSTNQPKK